MSEDAEGREVLAIQAPETVTDEDMDALVEEANKVLPEHVEVLVIGGGLETLTPDELAELLETTRERVLNNHRLAGAEPAEQPADPPWEDEEVEQFKEDMEDANE